jgi:diguanylate cyclase (GGDEF)-like protein/putative nucleotidyltransferase with HDIG domain
MVVFFACALAAELRPVSLDIAGKRVVSLAFVFIVSAQILFGWEAGVVVGALAMLGSQFVDWNGPLKGAFNCSVYAIAGLAAASVNLGHFVGLDGAGTFHHASVILVVFVEGGIFIAANVTLVCIAMALAERRPALPVIVDHFRHSGRAFFIMGFMAALAVTLWTVDPLLLVLLAGPLLTLSLYQRYALSTRVARHAAETDSLTGLANHRAFQQLFREAVEEATGEEPVTLCLIDLDDFKAINDTHGHAVGDDALAELAERLGAVEGAHAFRLGGDEFAMLFRSPADVASARIEAVQTALAATRLEGGAQMTISAGMASCPETTADADELQRLADMALYWSKRHGKNRWCVYSPQVVELSWSAEMAGRVDELTRWRAAENLQRLVASRSPAMAGHSRNVAAFAGEIAARLGVDAETVERIELAGRLHDVGKVGIPDHIVEKPAPLEPAELAVMRQHPELGAELLAGLGCAPVDDWIRHHHEHWDGTGYPDGLAGEQIPLASRIILVADAYDAMLSDRSYRAAMMPGFAIAELRRWSGRQFDPEVVEAALAVLRREDEAPAARRATGGVA